MGRAPCCDKANVKKGPWSPEEDAKLKSYIEQHGTGGNWIALPQKIGLKRCGKSCRLRWLNYLRPNLKHGGFSEEEENLICGLYISIGSRWSIMAAQLPGRTDNDIKNYWNTRLKKKLLGKHRKEKHVRKRNSGETSVAAQLPVLPPIPYSNKEPRFNDHASIRRLLIKLGGRFSDELEQVHGEHIGFQYPSMDEALIQPVLYNNPIDVMSSSDQYIPLINTMSGATNASHFDMVGADVSTMLSGRSADLLELQPEMYENLQKIQGLEFVYDDFINGEMTSLVFSATATNNDQGFLQGSTMGDFAVDKMRSTPWNSMMI